MAVNQIGAKWDTRTICANCRFHDNLGNCHRHAPMILSQEINGDTVYMRAWPGTAGDDWCGDFVIDVKKAQANYV